MSRLQFSSVEEMFQKLTADEVMRARHHSEEQAAKVQLELRDLVSQRYPDLLAGADTVLELTSRVASMRGMLKTIPKLCGELVTYQWNDSMPAEIPENAADSVEVVVGSKHQDQARRVETSLKWTQSAEQVWSALD